VRVEEERSPKTNAGARAGALKLSCIVRGRVQRSRRTDLLQDHADFAKLVELFDAHGVSFVSVTQQFLRVNYRLEKEGPFDPGEMILSGSIP